MGNRHMILDSLHIKIDYDRGEGGEYENLFFSITAPIRVGFYRFYRLL